MLITLRDRYRGCLLGGAVGDALGAGIEFLSLADIRRRRHGPRGVNGYVPAYGRLGAITDDTQMTLFTAEGLLRDRQQPAERRDPAAAIWAAYRRWLATQHGHRAADSWLASQEFLHHRRAPGVTCLSAMESGHPGTLSHPVNNSKGCGGVMRAAPAGLADGDPFSLGCHAAALTHGHPTGHQAAGALALMVSELSRGVSLRDAVAAAIGRLRRGDSGEETAAALAAAAGAVQQGRLSADEIGVLGEGWTADEALAIATHCALTAPSFRSGVLHAVNHGGDSDSTGAICGNLLGTALGAAAIDHDLVEGLEGRAIISQVADDLHDVFGLGQPPPAQRYPAGQEEDSYE